MQERKTGKNGILLQILWTQMEGKNGGGLGTRLRLVLFSLSLLEYSAIIAT